MSTPASVRAFGVFDLLSDTWKTSLRIALPAAPLLVVPMALQLWMSWRQLSLLAGGTLPWLEAAITLVAVILVWTVGYAALLRMAVDGNDGTPDLAAALRVGLARFFPCLGVGLLATLAALVGALFCIIPGIYVGLSLALALLLVVIDEKVGPVEALKMSWKRMNGYRLVYLGASLLVAFAFMAVTIPGSIVLGFLSGSASVVAGAPGDVGGAYALAANVFGAAMGSLAFITQCALLASLHRRILASTGDAAPAKATTEGAAPAMEIPPPSP